LLFVQVQLLMLGKPQMPDMPLLPHSAFTASGKVSLSLLTQARVTSETQAVLSSPLKPQRKPDRYSPVNRAIDPRLELPGGLDAR